MAPKRFLDSAKYGVGESGPGMLFASRTHVSSTYTCLGDIPETALSEISAASGDCIRNAGLMSQDQECVTPPGSVLSVLELVVVE